MQRRQRNRVLSATERDALVELEVFERWIPELEPDSSWLDALEKASELAQRALSRRPELHVAS